MAWEQDLINEIKGLREDIYNGVLNTNGGKGGGSIRRYSRVSPDDVESIDELLERYRHKETDIERFNKLKEIKQESEAFFTSHKDALDEILRKRKENIDLTEDEIELEEEYIRQNGRYADSIYQLGDDNKFSVISRQLTNIQGKVKGIYGEIKNLTEPWARADHAASQYAKTIGLAKKGMDQLRSSSIDNVVSGKIGAKYNMSTDELLQAQTNYVKGIGRNVRMSDADQENMAAMHAVMGERGNELALLFENFGVSMSSTAEHAGKMFEDASKAGISFEKYTDNVAKNFKIAQNYTFKNGIKGLESMAKKATAIRLDMQQVAALADKVSTVEGAIDVSAKLQVLGGPFAQMADPLGMLNEGLNDMESLQDRMAKMIGGMGSFDKATGEVKVSAFNKQRIKAAAEAMGVSYDNLMESVNAQAKRGEIDKQISASATASALPEEMKELVRNSGTFKDGKAGVSIRGQFKSLDELSDKDYEALKKETQTESQDIKDIAADLRSIKDAREGYTKQREAVQAKLFSFLGRIEKGITKMAASLNFVHFLTNALMGVLAGITIAGNIGSIIQGFKGFKGIFGGNTMRGFANSIGGTKGLVGNIGKKLSSTFGGFSQPKLPKGVKLNSAGRLIDAKTGRFIKQDTIKFASKGAVAKGGASRTMKRAAIKTFGKKGAGKAMTMASKFGAQMGKSALAGPLGLVAGAASIAGDILIDNAIAKGKMKKGGAGHHLAKAGTGAIAGATIGAIIPVIGPAIGAAIGGSIGLLKASKAKQERKLEEKLEGGGISIKGKYGRSSLKKINKGLERGEISDRMRRKLEKRGDTALLDKIDDTKIKRAEKKKKLLEAEGVLDNKKKKKLNIAKNRFGTANFTVGTANFGGRGLNSITKLFNPKKTWENRISRGKKILSGAVNGGGIILSAIKEKGTLKDKWNVIKEKNNLLKEGKVNATPKEFNININGSLKLTGENGQSVDIITELRKNPQMLRSLADMIAREISYLDKGTNVVQKG